jgi:hypothetical protein
VQNVKLIFCFQMSALLQRSCFINNAKTQCVTFSLEVYLTLQVKIANSLHAVVLNAIAWFILLLFKNRIPNNTVYQLGDCYHTLGIYYKRCICIECKGVHVLLSKTQWPNLMGFASSCINKVH